MKYEFHETHTKKTILPEIHDLVKKNRDGVKREPKPKPTILIVDLRNHHDDDGS